MIRLAPLLLALVTISLAADTKTETRLKSEVSDQAATIAAQASTINDLKAQLTAAHIEDAVLSHQAAAATGVAAGSSAEVVDLTSKLAVAQTETQRAKSVEARTTAKVADLQSQLATSRVQTATANGNASGSSAALKSKAKTDSIAIQTGTDAAEKAVQLAVQRAIKAAEDHDELIGDINAHSKRISQLAESDVKLTRLLVILSACILIQFVILLAGIRWRV